MRSSSIAGACLLLVGIASACRVSPWRPPMPPSAPQKIVVADEEARPQPTERITEDGTWLYFMPVAGKDLWVEIAADSAARRRGLMKRESLPEDRGMIFLYPEPELRSFWMKDTWIPLDLAYLRTDGTIIEILHLEPDGGDVSYASSEPAHWVLEVNAGWFEEHGVQAGDRVQLSESILALAPADPGER